MSRMTRLTRWAFASNTCLIALTIPDKKQCCYPLSGRQHFLLSVLNIHYPAAASAPGPFCWFSCESPAGWLRAASSAGALRLCRIPGKKKTRTAPLAESSQKIILFDYIVSIPRVARISKRSFAILFGRFLASDAHCFAIYRSSCSIQGFLQRFTRTFIGKAFQQHLLLISCPSRVFLAHKAHDARVGESSHD